MNLLRLRWDVELLRLRRSMGRCYLRESSRRRLFWCSSTSKRRPVCVEVESIRRGGKTRPRHHCTTPHNPPGMTPYSPSHWPVTWQPEAAKKHLHLDLKPFILRRSMRDKVYLLTVTGAADDHSSFDSGIDREKWFICGPR
jgi:hypothetical protein